MRCLRLLPIVLAISPQLSTAADAISGFGFGAGSGSDFIKPDQEFREIYKRSSDFSYDDQWNNAINNASSSFTGCAATSIGNNISVENKGAGNTVYILNQQTNDDASVNSLCSLGN